MPNKQGIKERVIRLIQDHAPITRRNLEQSFAASTRELAKQTINELLNNNYIAITGTGHRGSPETIVISAG
jgi:predicted HTH transcriptional regulator